MPVPATLSSALKQKDRAGAFRKYVERALSRVMAKLTDSTSYEEYDVAMREGFGVVVAEVLHLGLVDQKPDAIVGQLKEVMGGNADLVYYAFSAGVDVLESRKRKAGDEGIPENIVLNSIRMFHGVTVPTQKGDEMQYFHSEFLKSQQAAQKETIKSATASMKAKARNKKQKEGYLSLLTPSVHQRPFTEFWMKILNAEKPAEATLALLETFHTAIMPYLSSPLMVFDFLSDALSDGGLTGILALNGLFILITQHGLEYPSFFDKLYTLLTPDVCVIPQRGLFFELVGKFLCSIGLSSALVAAFVKRACRLALHAPTPAVFFLISLVKMLLLRHPQLMPLIHKSTPATPEDEELFKGHDPYDAVAVHPESSRALDSSCWEIRALINHYNPTVSSTAKELLDELKQPIGGSTPLVLSRATRTYQKMITRELMKEITGIPSTAYAEPVGFTDEGYSQTAVGMGFVF